MIFFLQYQQQNTQFGIESFVPQGLLRDVSKEIVPLHGP